MSYHLFSRPLWAALALAGVLAMPSVGACAGAFLTGTVTLDGKPAAGVAVTATGNNLVQTKRTDAHGRFSFSTLQPGAYALDAAWSDRRAHRTIELPASGADVSLELDPKNLGSIRVTASSAAPIRGAGTDLTLNTTMLTRTPAGGSFPELLVQLPGAARGANGVVHINGDHGDINYIVDGASIPQALNRVIGTEFDANDVAFVDVLQGAYPAQYGERFASVLNISTRTGTGPPGAILDLSGGSYANYDSTVGYHGPVGAGSLVLAVRDERSNYGLDPPDLSSLHNDASDASQFLRYTVPVGRDYLNLTMSHSYQTFQVPIDVLGGQPASSDDNETQNDTFATLQYRRAIADRGSLSVGAAYKRSQIRDFGDPLPDWAFGINTWVGGGGLPSDCFNALTIPNYANGTCAYTLFDDRTATDYKFNLDDALRGGAHEVRWGALYDVTLVPKLYDITLQPGNYLAPMFSPGTPAAAYPVIDNAPNVGHTEAAYLQDNWRMGQTYELDYGLRVDAFQIFSDQFDQGFSMFSPRIKLTRFFNPRASAYAYYGRFFTPFSFENVSPSAAYLLNLPLQPTLAQFDLKPQRDSDYEIGGHLPLGKGDLGLRVMQKDAADLIDDTQVGVTLLHQDINYQLGRIATQSAYYQQTLTRGGRFYVTANHTYSVNKGCETQLLAPCFGSSTDWTPADHMQAWGATSGLVLNDARGGWFSIDGEYGTGLSSAGCSSATPGFCEYTPHFTFNAVKGFAVGPKTDVTLGIGNLLNHQFFITYLNAQGNHYSPPLTVNVGLRFGVSH
jgi:hypothetical protein